MCMCVHMCAIMCVNESICEPQTWWSEDKCYLFERALCCSLLCAQLDDPLPPRILLAHFPLPPPRGAGIANIHPVPPDFTEVLGIQIQVFMLAWQMLLPLSHLPAPVLFLFFFLSCIH